MRSKCDYPPIPYKEELAVAMNATAESHEAHSTGQESFKSQTVLTNEIKKIQKRRESSDSSES
jgi:hypothetical protein